MAFADAVFAGTCELDGVQASRIDDLAALAAALEEGAVIPVTIANLAAVLDALRPAVLVDARMRKRVRPERQRDLAPLTIALGPNVVAGETAHLAIETQWGDELGTVIAAGSTRPRAIEQALS